MKNKFSMIFYTLLLTPLFHYASSAIIPRPTQPTTLTVVSAAPNNSLHLTPSNNQPASVQAAQSQHPNEMGQSRQLTAQEKDLEAFFDKTCCLSKNPTPCGLCCWTYTCFGCCCDCGVMAEAAALGIK